MHSCSSIDFGVEQKQQDRSVMTFLCTLVNEIHNWNNRTDGSTMRATDSRWDAVPAYNYADTSVFIALN